MVPLFQDGIGMHRPCPETPQGSQKAEELEVDSDFDPSDDDLPLSKRENILRHRDSRFICFDAGLKVWSIWNHLDMFHHVLFTLCGDQMIQDNDLSNKHIQTFQT